MHPWSKDRGCPFARVGPTSIRSPRGSPGDGGAASADSGYGAPPPSRVRGEWPAPGSLSPRGVGPKGSDETWPQSRVPRGGPEPSRAQLLQGRAASDKNPDGRSPGLPLANPETANPRVQAWSSGAQAGRILCGNQPRPLARRTRSFRPVTRPLSRGGCRSREGPECARPPSFRRGSVSRYAAAVDSLGRRTEDAVPDGAGVRLKTTRGAA